DFWFVALRLKVTSPKNQDNRVSILILSGYEACLPKIIKMNYGKQQ
ncbi:1209_t:CDS:1, partial [Racocetra persica]